jgi:hypothetical protein
MTRARVRAYWLKNVRKPGASARARGGETARVKKMPHAPKFGLLCTVVAFFAAALGVTAEISTSAHDPFALTPGNGEMPGRPLDYPQPHLGKVQIPPIRSLPVTTAVIIMQGQSLIANRAEGTYTTKNRDNALNFNIYDGELYQCSNPVLGTDLDVSHPSNTNSSTCQIADLLINAGTFRTVIMVPTAVGGTLCSDWTLGGALYQRIVVTMLRLASRGLSPTWILNHQGESDHLAGTPRAALAQCYRNLSQAYVNHGSGSARFFVPTESILYNVANSTVTGAQADAVAWGCPQCRRGADYDSLTGPVNRWDGTHWTQTGAASAAALDAAVITNCKGTSCLRRRRIARRARPRYTPRRISQQRRMLAE